MKNTQKESPSNGFGACLHRCLRGLLGAVLGLSWHVNAGAEAGSVFMQSRQDGLNARIEVLSGVYAASGQVDAGQSRLLFYRTAQDSALPGATSVFVNQDYHTSLVPGAWSELCLAPASLEVGARQMRVGQPPRDLMDAITLLEGQGGQTLYLRVHEGTGKPVLQPVSSEQAQQDLMGLRRQVHTLSRVARGQPCKLAPATAQAPQQIRLAADALFKFGRSDFDGMTALGVQALLELVAHIRRDFARIEQLHIVGHADPLGQRQANEALALARAETVRNFMERQKLPVQRITSEGRGDREPVARCERTVSVQSIACHQPSRRVVVEVVGERR